MKRLKNILIGKEIFLILFLSIASGVFDSASALAQVVPAESFVQQVIMRSYEQSVKNAIARTIAARKLQVSAAVMQQMVQDAVLRGAQEAAVKNVIQSVYAEGVIKARQEKISREIVAKELEARVQGAMKQAMMQQVMQNVSQKIMEQRINQVLAVEAQQQAYKKAVIEKVVTQRMEQAVLQQQMAQRQAALQAMFSQQQ